MTTAVVPAPAAQAPPPPRWSWGVPAPAAQPPPPPRWSWGVREVVMPAVLLALLSLPLVWLSALLFDSEAERLEEDGANMRTSGEKGGGRSLYAPPPPQWPGPTHAPSQLTLFGLAMAWTALAALWLRWRALSLSVPRTRSRRTRAAMAVLPVSYGALALVAYATRDGAETWYRVAGLCLVVALADVYARAMALHLRGAPDATLWRLLLAQRLAENVLFALHLLVIHPAFYDAKVPDAARVGYLLCLPFVVDLVAFPARRVAATRVDGEQRVEMAALLPLDILAALHLASRGFVVGMSTATGSLAAALACSVGEAAARLTLSRRDAFYERVLCSCLFSSSLSSTPSSESTSDDGGLRKDVVAVFLGLDQVLELWATLVMGATHIAFRISASREPPELGAQLGVVGMQLALEVLSDVGAPLAAAKLLKRRARSYLGLVQHMLARLRGAGRLFWAILAFVATAQTWAVLFHMFVPDQQHYICVWPTTEDPDWFRVACADAERWE